jgi:hypothetical protein
MQKRIAIPGRDEARGAPGANSIRGEFAVGRKAATKDRWKQDEREDREG